MPGCKLLCDYGVIQQLGPAKTEHKNEDMLVIVVGDDSQASPEV